MATTKEQAQEDIFAAVSDLVKEAGRYAGIARGTILAQAALAYRYAAGGAQPGGGPSVTK